MTIDLPIRKPTMPAFGGRRHDLRDLDPPGERRLRSSRTPAVFAVRCGVKGVAEPKFG
jgi:hypothetical protein